MSTILPKPTMPANNALAGYGMAFNRSVINFVQRSVISGFELATKIAHARNPAEVFELQLAYWQTQLGLTSQAALEAAAAKRGEPATDTSPREREQVAANPLEVEAESVGKTPRKQNSRERKSVALARSKVDRKTSKAPTAQRVKAKKTSRHKPSRKPKR
jgi:phasin protein